jgi:hypothetical protein
MRSRAVKTPKSSRWLRFTIRFRSYLACIRPISPRQESDGVSGDRPRAAAAHLLFILFKHYKAPVARVLLPRLAAVLSQSPLTALANNDSRPALLKEAYYFVLSAGGLELVELLQSYRLDFAEWYQHKLRVEISSGICAFLRRRVLLLCSDWLEALTQVSAFVCASECMF